MRKPWESILIGYNRKFEKDGSVVIPNYKLCKLFIDKYMSQKSYHVEKVNGSLKPCCDPKNPYRLIVCTSVLFKYIDSGRIIEGVSIRDYVEKIKLEYSKDLEYIKMWETLIEVRNEIFNPNSRLCARI